MGGCYVTYIRKCIVFPIDNLEPRLVDMTIRSVTEKDVLRARGWHSHIVDLVDHYGSEYPKIRVRSFGKYLIYYNLSPKLLLNRCVSRIVGIDLDKLGSKLFWRGDVVVMKFESQSEYSHFIEGRDADLSVVGQLEEMMRDSYYEGYLQQELAMDGGLWKVDNLNWGTALIAAVIGHWRRGRDDDLDHINELRELIGHSPIPNDSIKGVLLGLLAEGFATIQESLSPPITSPPVLPPELERKIFELCARNNRATCLKLVLVSRRVREWIDPILFETVVLDDISAFMSTFPRFELFMANTQYKPSEFYSKYVKNLWIFTRDNPDGFERILTLCNGVENLMLISTRCSINPPFIPFLDIPDAGSRLRRLACKLEDLFPPWSTGHGFQHPCFANLTHLHLYDEIEEWSTYTGFDSLISLTHLAFACCGPEALATVAVELPALKYVALCSYKSAYGWPRVINHDISVERYGINVVWLDGVTIEDWKSGTAGTGDFWDVVEEEVVRRRAVAACISDNN